MNWITQRFIFFLYFILFFATIYFCFCLTLLLFSFIIIIIFYLCRCIITESNCDWMNEWIEKQHELCWTRLIPQCHSHPLFFWINTGNKAHNDNNSLCFYYPCYRLCHLYHCDTRYHPQHMVLWIQHHNDNDYHCSRKAFHPNGLDLVRNFLF